MGMLASAVAFVALCLVFSQEALSDGVPFSFKWGPRFHTSRPHANAAGGLIELSPQSPPLSFAGSVEKQRSRLSVLADFGGFTTNHAWCDPPLAVLDLESREFLSSNQAAVPVPRIKPAGGNLWVSENDSGDNDKRVLGLVVGGGANHQGQVLGDFWIARFEETSPAAEPSSQPSKLPSRNREGLENDVHFAPADVSVNVRWTAVPFNTATPSPRTGARVSAVTRYSSLLFGGMDNSSFENDIHELTQDSNGKWEWSLPAISAASPLPEGRSEHAQCTLPSSDKTLPAVLVVFGGVRWHRKPQNHLNDVWTLTPSHSASGISWSWNERFKRTEDPDAPQPRVGPTITPLQELDASSIVVFGGYGAGKNNQGHFYDDVWVFDLVSATWHLQVPLGDAPQGRWAHVAFLLPLLPPVEAEDSSVTMLICGGYNDHVNPSYFDDVVYLTWHPANSSAVVA